MNDKLRWNEKHQTMPMPSEPSSLIQKYIPVANQGKALDIACGTGRNTHYLADMGFCVDAVDVSDYALSCIKPLATINKIETDLSTYCIAPESYDLIVNINFLDRRLFPQIKEGLKPNGTVIFETFIIAHGEEYHQPGNIDFVLRKNELLHTFLGLDIIYYEEHDGINLRGEKVKIASLVGRKGK